MKQWQNVARLWLVALATAAVFGTAGCGQRAGGDNPHIETGGMPPHVQEEFNRRMQGAAQQGGAPGGMPAGVPTSPPR